MQTVLKLDRPIKDQHLAKLKLFRFYLCLLYKVLYESVFFRIVFRFYFCLIYQVLFKSVLFLIVLRFYLCLFSQVLFQIVFFQSVLFLIVLRFYLCLFSEVLLRFQHSNSIQVWGSDSPTFHLINHQQIGHPVDIICLVLTLRANLNISRAPANLRRWWPPWTRCSQVWIFQPMYTNLNISRTWESPQVVTTLNPM